MILRDYQKEAVKSIINDFDVKGNSVAVLATGAGKSVIIAEVAHYVNNLNKPLLIFQPNKEILEQNLEKLRRYIPESDIGIYSASMGKRSISKVTLATIGSVRKSAIDFIGFKDVLIDEAHMLNPENDASMYMDFLNAIGAEKVIGLTATPFRMSVVYIPFNESQETSIKIITRMQMNHRFFWKRIIVNVTTQYLLDRGYLSPIKYFNNTIYDQRLIPLNKSASDFNIEKYEEMILPMEEDILDAIIRLSNVSHSVLVFCISVDQAKRFAEVVNNSAIVSAETKKKDRANIIESFKEGKIKIVFNVGTLTTGFDHPRLDGIVLVRPTRSLALYSQMVGRGLRIHPDKEMCRVVDFSGTYKTIGPAESIEVYKTQDDKWQIRSSKRAQWHGKVLYRIDLSK